MIGTHLGLLPFSIVLLLSSHVRPTKGESEPSYASSFSSSEVSNESTPEIGAECASLVSNSRFHSAVTSCQAAARKSFREPFVLGFRRGG